MSSSRMISLAETVSWFAWDQRFTAEDFLAADRLKVSAGEILLYSQYLKEGKMPAESAKALEMYHRAEADDQKIMKRIEDASGHSHESKVGWNAAKKDLDAAFLVIVTAIQDCRVKPVQGQRDIDNEGGSRIPRRWFNENPEPIAFYEMNAIGLRTLIEPDGNELPNLQNGWTDVEFDWDEIERLRDGTSAWPHKRSEFAATVGRPSHRNEIREAYEELVKAGEIDFDGPKTATYEPIRRKVLRVLDGDVTGLGSEAIRLVIAPLFDRDKAARS